MQLEAGGLQRRWETPSCLTDAKREAFCLAQWVSVHRWSTREPRYAVNARLNGLDEIISNHICW
jgi:hypothetical protein